MRQPDWLPFTASTAATAATVSNMTASRPAAATGAVAGGGFNSAFQQVRNDVAAFIAHGGGDSSFPVSSSSTAGASAQALSPQAIAMLLRSGNNGSGAIDATGTSGGGADADTQRQFLAAIQPWAEETAGKLGVSPQIVAAHAALESGWGRNPLKNGGVDSNNLFGLKAGGAWQGAVAAATTTEYEHGAALKKVERFRSYPDTASAFRDYADMLTSNPRYQGALNTGDDARAFATGLARGGYATDPGYADKLSRLATRLQRAAADPAAPASVTATGN